MLGQSAEDICKLHWSKIIQLQILMDTHRSHFGKDKLEILQMKVERRHSFINAISNIQYSTDILNSLCAQLMYLLEVPVENSHIFIEAFREIVSKTHYYLNNRLITMSFLYPDELMLASNLSGVEEAKVLKTCESRTATANSRAKDHGAFGKLYPIQVLRTLNYYQWKCPYCGGKIDLNFQQEKRYFDSVMNIDHIIAMGLGGNNYIQNIVPCCARCNMEKDQGDVFLWFYEHGIDIDSFMHHHINVVSNFTRME